MVSRRSRLPVALTLLAMAFAWLPREGATQEKAPPASASATNSKSAHGTKPFEQPKPTKGPRLGGGPAHERLLLANLAAALFTHKRITTTETKAKRLRPLAERLITFAKRGDLHARRRVLAVIGDKAVVHELFAITDSVR